MEIPFNLVSTTSSFSYKVNFYNSYLKYAKFSTLYFKSSYSPDLPILSKVINISTIGALEALPG